MPQAIPFDENQTLTLSQFSKMSGINDMTMNRWKIEGLISVPEAKGKYKLGTLIREVFAVAKTDRLPGRQASNPMQEAKINLLNAQVAKQELQVAKAAGQLADVAELEEKVSEAAHTIKKKLEVIGDRIGAQVSGSTPEEAAKIINKEIELALKALCEVNLRS